MILFFYGEDNYRLKQKIKQLKDKFVSASLGDTNLSVLDGPTVTFDELMRQVLAMPFLAKSRLVIVNNLITGGKKSNSDKSAANDKNKSLQEKVVEALPKVPESTVLVFAEEGMPDRRTSLFKKLAQPKISQEFKPLEGIELSNWVKQEVKARGAEIEPAAVQKLIDYVGSDLWRLSNEIEKLSVFRYQFSDRTTGGGSRITSSDIDLFVQPEVESDIFGLIDALAAKNLKRSYTEMRNLLVSGEPELKILTMIVYQYRNLLVAKDLSERASNRLSHWDLVKKAGFNPYVAQKTISQIRSFTLEELKNNYRELLNCDLAIKTGKTDSQTAMDLLVAKFCQ